MTMTDAIQWQTDFESQDRFTILLGIDNPKGGRSAGLEIGAYEAKNRSECFAFARRAIGHTVRWVYANAGNNCNEYDWDPDYMNADSVIVGTTVERFTDESGTFEGWDIDSTTGTSKHWRN